MNQRVWQRRGRALLHCVLANLVIGTASAGGHVSITTTEHGIPHIRADGFGSLGFGYGYAMARNDVCGMADMFLTVSGRRAEVIGEDQGDLIRLLGRAPIANAVNDLTRRFLNDEAHMRAAKAALSNDLRQLVQGYAAGYNRYLQVTPSTALPAACRSSGTVRPITDDDVIRRVAAMATLLGSGLVLEQIYAAEPPRGVSHPPIVKTASNRMAVNSDAGSNAYAFGRESTENGSGILLGNPHFFWDGPDRFVEMHLTIPGVYDAMGISQLGMPLVGIGFNDSLAWSQTVSTDARALVYQLELDPRNPTRYRVDGRWLSMTKTRVSIPVLTADHRRATRHHTFWKTIYGPVLGGPDFPWTHRSAFALADMNRDNHRMLAQMLDIATSHSVSELRLRLQATVGLPWLNTIAVDRSGLTLFADISVTPNIDEPTLKRCRQPVDSPFDGLFTFVAGSDSTCAAQIDAAAPQAGIMSGTAKPAITRLDFVENSNDSHWLVTPTMRLEGFSSIVGNEQAVRSFRTRQAMIQVTDRLSGADGLPAARLTPAAVREIMMSGRSLQAELVVDPVLSSCGQMARDDSDAALLARACKALAGWDRRFTLESRGAHLFAEFVSAAKDADAEDLSKHEAYWSVPFSASDPVNTPRGFRGDAPGVKEALLGAARRIEEAGLALDARLQDIQFVIRNGQRIPLPGGATFSHMGLTLQPNVGYTDPVTPSNSYIQVVTFDAAGPVADAILASSQSPDEASPFYMDQTQMYSRGEWVRLPFHPDAIAAGRVGPVLELTTQLP